MVIHPLTQKQRTSVRQSRRIQIDADNKKKFVEAEHSHQASDPFGVWCIEKNKHTGNMIIG